MNATIENWLFTFLTVLLLFTVPAWAQSGGDYVLEWSTIDGGGGQSSGGSYVLSGTIGQPDAAYSAGGPYEVLGGFWPGGPLCVVNFEHYARFAEWWMVTGDDIPADLYKDQYDIVDWYDLDVFVDGWLDYCRLDWPLK
ncbi:MAG: hypothetical protein ACYTEQ_29510 [Planctomycetota bacterium]|jgi:hypothetical protein